MADVYAVFGTLLALGIAFPGMLTAWWLLFAGAVERAQKRLEATPGRCFGLGLGVAILLAIPISILLALSVGPANFLGAVIVFGSLAFASLGAAGMSALMAERLGRRVGANTGTAGTFVRAAVALELAAAFPIIGWFIFTPLTILTSLGAATFAALHWMPRPAAGAAPEAAASQA
jgi:hypothetical protein